MSHGFGNPVVGGWEAAARRPSIAEAVALRSTHAIN